MKKIALLIDTFNASISQIKKLNLDKLTELNQNIILANDCLQQFRIIIRNNDFSSQKSEIKFFKYQKPYIQGRLQYYKTLNTYLLKQPFGSITQQKVFLQMELNNLDCNSCINLDFIKYYKLDENKFDHLFYLRDNNQFDMFIDPSYHSDDPEFSTNHDNLVAQLITNELLKSYFSNELKLLLDKDSKVIIEEVKPSIFMNLPWTGTKTELVELIYALIATGSINNGQTELKIIVEICKELFNIELVNIYKTFNEIKEREKDPTKFLNKLTNNLINKINLDR